MTSANDQTSESPGGVRLCRFAHNAMACTFEAIIPQAERSYAQQAAEAAFAEVDRLEGELSRFAPHSDISRINALKSGQATVVCIEVIDVLQQALALNEDTGGAFDVTYASRHRAEADLCRQPLSIERAARRITAHIDDVRVDLGGLGKGYALDQMATVLRDWDINAALVHSGQSTSRAWGAFGHADGWKSGHPRSRQRRRGARFAHPSEPRAERIGTKNPRRPHRGSAGRPTRNGEGSPPGPWHRPRLWPTRSRRRS